MPRRAATASSTLPSRLRQTSSSALTLIAEPRQAAAGPPRRTAAAAGPPRRAATTAGPPPPRLAVAGPPPPPPEPPPPPDLLLLTQPSRPRALALLAGSEEREGERERGEGRIRFEWWPGGGSRGDGICGALMNDIFIVVEHALSDRLSFGRERRSANWENCKNHPLYHLEFGITPIKCFSQISPS